MGFDVGGEVTGQFGKADSDAVEVEGDEMGEAAREASDDLLGWTGSIG